MTTRVAKLLKFLKKNPDFKGKPNEVEALQPIAEYVKIVSLLYEELYQGLELNELHYEAARLQARLIEQFIKTEKIKLADAAGDRRRSGDPDVARPSQKVRCIIESSERSC